MNTIFKLMTITMICAITTPIASAQVSALKEHNVDNPVDISADRLEVKQKENIAFFTGNVVVTQSDMSLVSDRITVFYEGDREEGNTSSISRLDASGNVVMTSLTETIRSTWGVYDLEEKIITLGGQVVFNNAEGQITSPRLQVNLNTGQITMDGGRSDDDNTGRVTGQFTPPEN
ncbi:MAG: LptA/OstA family protein [Emcibacteraceae bacterium]|nr:LptA/OstA family protein [Emcibacteraceae bacterium]